MKNFIQRAITGLIFVAVLIGCIIGSPLSFGVLFCIISAMATAEFCNLMNQQEGVKMNRNICVLGSMTLFLCFFYYGMNPAQTGIFIPYLIIIIYLMISELYLKKEHPLNSWAYAMLSQLYVGLPFALLNVLAFQSNGIGSGSEYLFIFPLSIFASHRSVKTNSLSCPSPIPTLCFVPNRSKTVSSLLLIVLFVSLHFTVTIRCSAPFPAIIL